MSWQPIETAPKDGTDVLVYPDCKKPVSSGTQMPDGSYVHRCLDHSPYRLGKQEAA